MATRQPPTIQSADEVEQVPAHRRPPRAGIVLVNLGTPAAPTAAALRAYLREFLSDRRVVELPRALWWPLLYGLILPFRAPRSARAYRRIWTDHGSPLLVTSRSLADRLGDELKQQLPGVQVKLAMTYGRPSIDRAIARLREDNIQRLLVVPLYPQYSATTTAAVFDRVTAALGRLRWLPEVRFINDYHQDAGWQRAIAESISEFRRQHGRAERLLFSFHGIPRRNLLAGDPYFCQCHASARQIAERAGLAEADWQVSFQSRLGRAEWLRPYTDHTLGQLARDGVRRVQVVCPGFAVDCLETIDEIANENREAFIAAGGERLDYIPCLNDSGRHVRVLAELCRRHGQGWPEFAGVRAAGRSELDARWRRAAQAAARLGLK